MQSQHSGISFLLAGTALALSFAIALPAAAQEGAAEQGGGLEDIVVTARKRSESVQDVPVAVAAISEATIARQDLTSIEKIAARTPNLNVGRASNGSGAQLTLRGIGSSSTSIGIEQSVAVVVDGVYYGQGRIINEGFFDLGGIEILKGPQALFFGKNATAGVISIKTADPTDTFTVKARAGYEFKAQQAQVEAAVSGPIGENLGVRVAVRGSKMWGGYYRNESPVRNIFYGGNNYAAAPVDKDTPGEKELLGRLTLKWEPTDNLTATFKVSGSRNEVDSSSWNYVAYHCGLPSNKLQLATEYSCSTNDFVTHHNKMPLEVAAVQPYAKSDGRNYNLYRSFGATANIVYDLNDVSITSVTNYNWNNNRWACACDFQTSAFGVHATENSSFSAFSSELRALTQFDAPINLMVGAYYQKTKRKFDQWVNFGVSDNGTAAGENRYVDSSKDSQTDGETIAAFTQVTWKVVPTVELAAGVRYTHETKKSYFVQPFVSAGLSPAWWQGSCTDPTIGHCTLGDQTFNNWSPEATVSWKPTSDILVYGAFKTAYKSGGFSNGGIDSKFGNAAVDLLFNPEKARGFEMGVKTELMDRQLRLNFGAYTYAYNDLQIDFFNSTIVAFQTLTADARTKGVEVEFEFAPRSLDGFNLRGSINYNRARYTKFPFAPCYGGQTISEGCNLVGNSRQNLTGAPLSVAPKWVGNLGMSYDTAVGNGLMAGVSVDTRFSSSYLVSGFGNPDSRQAKYGILDASIRIGSEDERWQFSVIGKNLTNRLYVTGGVDGPNTGAGTGTASGVHADQMGFGSLPRTVMAQITTKF